MDYNTRYSGITAAMLQVGGCALGRWLWGTRRLARRRRFSEEHVLLQSLPGSTTGYAVGPTSHGLFTAFELSTCSGAVLPLPQGCTTRLEDVRVSDMALRGPGGQGSRRWLPAIAPPILTFSGAEMI